MKRGKPLRRTGALNRTSSGLTRSRMKKAPRRAGPMPDDVRENVLRRDAGCTAHRRQFALDVPCAGRLHVHHRILRSQGGPDTEANLLTLCDHHHRLAHDHRRTDAEACGIILRRRDHHQ